jgi:hypothetical protein
VGRFVGARGDDLVFVDNVTAGANAVLRSLALRVRQRERSQRVARCGCGRRRCADAREHDENRRSDHSSHVQSL